MKIVVLDGYTENPGDLSWDALSALGDVTVYDRTAYTESPLILQRIGDAEVVVVNKTPISNDTIDKCPDLKMIAVLATGYNVVDCSYAREKGIIVCNVPTYGTAAVGQFAIAMLLEICHHVAHHSDTVYAGKWNACADWCYWDYPLIELDGKTMGIIGFGRIGQELGKMGKALGMKVIVTGRTAKPELEEKFGVKYVSMDELLEQSDFVSLHTPALGDKPLVDAEFIAKMEKGAILINTSRGKNVDEAALLDALNAGQLRGAGLDVWFEEPTANHDLYCHPAVSCTPHIGAQTVEAQKRIGAEVVDIISGFAF